LERKLKLLILSFYYQPDLCAGSFRITALLKALLEKLPEDAEIDLITTLPNRYSSFCTEAPCYEQFKGLTVYRTLLPSHHSGMADQSKAFFAFASQALKIIGSKRYDLIFASSSRLMTAALGAVVAHRSGSTLYLDIRDIFADTIKDVLPKNIAMLVHPFFSLLERWTINSAAKINLVSMGFAPYFKKRYPQSNLSFFSNGIDDEFMRIQPTGFSASAKDVLQVVYAGNMGDGQGLHKIIPKLANMFSDRLQFVLVGDGGRRKQLAEAIAAEKCQNVELLEPVNREKLIEIYQSADILFLHLNNYDAFKKVLPSKLFEYAALGKPIWAGIAGYPAEFTENNISNAAIFSPCDAEAAALAFKQLSIVTEPRANFTERYARKNIMQAMAADILAQIHHN
jgi:glycosyltransferase involved in cell wall biosynthesis